MRRIKASTPLIAIPYETGTDAAPLMQRIVACLAAQGVACAGFIQRAVERAGRSRCDMMLEDIRSGEQLPISEDRGPGARGCQLDEAELIRATTRAVDCRSTILAIPSAVSGTSGGLNSVAMNTVQVARSSSRKHRWPG